MWNSQTLPRVLLVDMNSFFASVEQQANPFLRGKPLGVSPSRHKNSCLIGTSKEAKAMGIKNGIPLYKARRICPEIIVIESEPEKYREVNRHINRIFLDYTKTVETYSVDESFLDLRSSKLNPMIVGGLIKKRIRQEVGEWLTCSVGVAANKFMAKLAADMQKPDGLTVIWRDQLPEIYKHKRLTDLWGIARGWEKRLAKLNIISPGQLWNYPVQNLISAFGKPGYFIWERVNGLEQDIISDPNDPNSHPNVTNNQTQGFSNSEHSDAIRRLGSLPKSFGHSWVLNFRTTDKEPLAKAILRLAEKASRRMRREGFIAYGMYLSITMVDGSRLHRSQKLNFPIETGWDLYQEALRIWKPWKFQENVMHLAVGFTYLSIKTHQLPLFEDKKNTLTPTLDRINDKYGEFTIRSGLLTNTSDFAPDAIAFGK